MTIAKLLYHPITIFSVTILAIIFYFSLDASSKKTQKSAENITVLEHEVNQISENLIDLEEKIEFTSTEEFKEKVVRNELLLQEEGEYVLKIPEETEGLSSETCNDTCQKCPDCTTTNTFSSPVEAWLELLL